MDRQEQAWIREEYKNRSPSVSREETLQIIEHAGLMQALLAHLQKNSQELIDAGADQSEIRSMRVQDFKASIFMTLPLEAVNVIVSWLVERCKGDLETFVKEHGDNLEQKLCGYLMPLLIHVKEDGGNKPPDLQKRARIYLAASEDKECRGVVSALQTLGYSKPGKNDSGRLYASMRDIAHDTWMINAKPNGHPQLFVAFACAIAIKALDREVASSLLREVARRDNALDEDERMHGKLKEYYSSKLFKNNVILTKPKKGALKDYSIGNELEVFAVCNHLDEREIRSYAFSKPIAVRNGKDDEWRTLTLAEFEQLFRESGSIIHLHGKHHPPLPRLNSYAVWEVEEQSMSNEDAEHHKTRVRVRRKVETAYRVFSLDHIPSTRNDLARQWIRHATEIHDDKMGELLLRFEDGVFAHLTGSYSNLMKDDFTQGLATWKNLQMLEADHGKHVYVGELPDNPESLYLTPPVGALKRRINQLKDFTASEKDQFNQAFELMGLNHALAKRLSAIDFEGLDFTDEQLEDIIFFLEQSEGFKKDIAKHASARNKEKDDKLKEATHKLERQETKLRAMQDLKKKKHTVLDRLEAKMKEHEKDLRLQTKDARFYEQMQVYMAAAYNDLDERISKLEAINKRDN